MTTAPQIPPYGRHILICSNGTCATTAEVASLVRRLRQLNREHGLDRLSNPRRIAYVSCGCLGVCAGGPILVVYPEGVWYAGVDAIRLERIYAEHLVQGHPVEEYILHRHYPAGSEPAYAPDLRGEPTPDPIQLAAEEAAAQKEASRLAAASEPVPDHVAAARQRRKERDRDKGRNKERERGGEGETKGGRE